MRPETLFSPICAPAGWPPCVRWPTCLPAPRPPNQDQVAFRDCGHGSVAAAEVCWFQQAFASVRLRQGYGNLSGKQLASDAAYRQGRRRIALGLFYFLVKNMNQGRCIWPNRCRFPGLPNSKPICGFDAWFMGCVMDHAGHFQIPPNQTQCRLAANRCDLPC